mmetsp:Transcript_66142/g.158219  ORF Transcript_66142/g.158219 Transcript_66142/m.158219 type:complete len:324 (+) Transcript_66142:68-1039(+)
MAAARRDLVYDVIPRLACSIRDRELQDRAAGYHNSNILESLFANADVDRNGALNRIELRDLLLRVQPDLTSTELEALFAEFDRNGDGQVDFAEFKRSLLEALTLVDQGLRWRPRASPVMRGSQGVQPQPKRVASVPQSQTGFGGTQSRPGSTASRVRPGPAPQPVAPPHPADQAEVGELPEDFGHNSWVLGEDPDDASKGNSNAVDSQPRIARGVSQRSQVVLQQLAEARKELDKLERSVSNAVRQWELGQLSDGAARTELAQLEAQAKQLETQRLDNLYTSELSEYGKQQAKTIKKELLAQVGRLLEETLPQLFAQIPRVKS